MPRQGHGLPQRLRRTEPKDEDGWHKQSPKENHVKIWENDDKWWF
jgi:hypothetical protein